MNAPVFGDAGPGNWSAALRQLAGVLPEHGPSIAVSRSGASAAHLAAAFTPADLIEAW